MTWKPGGTPEAEKPPGMAEFSEGLKVARVEVKALMEATGKVSVKHVPVSDPWQLKLRVSLCVCGQSKCHSKYRNL